MRPKSLPPILSFALLLAGLGAQSQDSTFGHARARELAELGRLPTAHDIVVRHIVNYHRHLLPLPKAGADVALDVRFDRPLAGAGDEVWLQIGYTTAPQGDRALAAPCAIALVVDVSGSMADAGKMTAVKAGLVAFVGRLRADDDVALITFSTEAQVAATRRPRGDGRWLLDAVERLEPGGNTNLHAGLMLGLDELARADAGPGSRRAIVLTDGIANTGVTGPDQIVADARRRSGTSIDISTIGVGQDLDVPLLQRLAAGARGLFHFVADAQDVQKVFVAEADALLAAIARRVHLRIDLPDRGLQVVQVLHEGARVDGERVELDLPDLNAGVTGVVLLRCRVGAAAEDLAATAEITFTGADRQRSARERAHAVLRTGPRPRGDGDGADVEVRKNAAIAVLAQGLADMAGACDARRWADADRVLQGAIDEARRLFPGADADVQRVRDIVAGHARTLRRYVDRFRDF